MVWSGINQMTIKSPIHSRLNYNRETWSFYTCVNTLSSLLQGFDMQRGANMYVLRPTDFPTTSPQRISRSSSHISSGSSHIPIMPTYHPQSGIQSSPDYTQTSW